MSTPHHRIRRTLTALSTVLAVAFGGLLVAPSPALAEPVANPFPELISRWEPCEPNTGVTVIVDYMDLNGGKVEVGCALGDQTSGYAALHNAGFATTDASAYPGFIARINDFPTDGDAPNGGAYWSYWKASQPGQSWGYSGVGAGTGSNRPKTGSIEGWAFGASASGSNGQPRVPAMDGAGVPPDFVRASEPSSQAAIDAATAWIDPVTDNLSSHESTFPDSPITILAVIESLRAQLVAGRSVTSVAPAATRLRPYLSEFVTGSGDTQLEGSYAAQALQLLAEVDDPQDTDRRAELAAGLAGLAYPDGTDAGLFASRRNGSGARVLVSPLQHLYLDALLAATGQVPAESVNALLATQADSGSFGTAAEPANVGTTGGVVATLVRIKAAGSSAVSAGTVSADALSESITRATDWLVSKQLANGGWLGAYPHQVTGFNVPPSFSGDTTATTAWAALGLEAAGRHAEAKAASRYLALQQYTPATEMDAHWLGAVALGSKDFDDRRADRYRFDPNPIDEPQAISSSHPRLETFVGTYLPPTLWAIRVWARVPFADAGVSSDSVSGLTTNSAHVEATLRPSSEAYEVWVSYGPVGGTSTSTELISVPAGEGTTPFSVDLTDLTPGTDYTVTVEGAVPELATSFRGETTTFSTIPVDSAPAATVADATIREGADATFTAVTTGYPVPSVTWQRLVGTDWQDISTGDGLSVDGNELTVVAPSRSLHGTQFRAKAANDLGTSYSPAARLLIEVAPSITTDVQNVSVSEGSDATFSIVPAGYPDPTVIWQRQTGAGWQDIAADDQYVVDGRDLTVKTPALAQSGTRFRAKVSNAVGSVYSRAATLTVTAKPDLVSTRTSVSVGRVVYGRTARVVVGVSGGASGSVSVRVGSRTIVAPLSGGKAALVLPAKSLKPGSHTLRVSYAGVAGRFGASSTTVRVTVAKAAAAVRVKAPARVKRCKAAKFTVTVAASGVRATGRVTVKVAGKSRTVRLNGKGRATVRVKVGKKTKPGRKAVTVRYRGDSYVAPAQAKKTTTTVTR